MRADYEEDKDGEPPSPFGSHILHFYFPSAKQLILCCLPAFPAPDFFGANSHFVCATHKGARAGRLDGLEGGEGEAFSDFFMAH